jgi:hypothetical protein
VADANRGMAAFGHNPDSDHQWSVTIDIAGGNQKCRGHREIEDAPDLDLPDVKRRPWWNHAEEPPGKTAPAMPKSRCATPQKTKSALRISRFASTYYDPPLVRNTPRSLVV